MKDLLQKFENKEPEIVFNWKDSETEAEGWAVINSLRGGAAGGGTRMRKGLDMNEVLSLAKTMEVKFSVAGPAIGGAKSGINFDPNDPRKKGVLERWFKAVSPLLKHYYGTGGDLNVDESHEVIPMTENCGIWHPQEGVFNGHFKPTEAEKINRIGQLRQGVIKEIKNPDFSPSVDRKYTVADMITGYGVAQAVRHYYGIYGGILIGGLYGLLMRFLFGVSFRGSNFEFADLFSVTFVWIVPIIVGLTPLIFATREDLEDVAVRFSRPALSVLAFFIFCFITGLEDIICLIIIAIPFLTVAGISGAIFGSLILYIRKKRGILYSILLLPFLTGILEPNFPTPTEKFETTSSLIINADKSKIWQNIVRVNKIAESEYKKGLFNYAGIPRPLYAELDVDKFGGTRIGHFEGGLKFQENIIKWSKEKSITFDIKIIPSAKSRTIFERHMLNGQHFKFLNATYELKEISKERTELSLTTTYQLDTKLNFYGEFWGQILLTDFQDRLIQVIKNRCE